MFKLIAIKTYFSEHGLSEETNRIWLSRLRVLKPGTLYKFYNNYDVKDEQITKNESSLPDDFFHIKNNQLNVSISALVGKNGMGKSSLIDLYLRIMNNAAYCLYKSIDKDIFSNLHFVRYIYARLFFEIDGWIAYLDQHDDELTFRYINRQERGWNSSKKTAGNIDEENARKWLGILPFSDVINYSSYSYNTDDYINETNDDTEVYNTSAEHCWLTPLFHRNDNYQLPIVINPFRNEGNIDYNNERSLTMDRLFLLTGIGSKPLKEILDNKYIEAYVFDTNIDFSPTMGTKFVSKNVYNQCLNVNIINDDIPQNNRYKIIDSFGLKVLEIWGNCFGYDLMKLSQSYNKDRSDVQRCLNYIVYKTIKVTTMYRQYAQYRDKLNNENDLKAYIKQLYQDSTSCKNKLFRCFAFLIFHFYGSRDLTGNNEFFIDEYWNRLYEILSKQVYKDNDIIEFAIPTYDDIKPHIWRKIELLPAPSFIADFLIKEDLDKKNPKKDLVYMPFSSLSSGEKQMIFLFTTLVYHIQNLEQLGLDQETISGEAFSNQIAYYNIQIIFDEIELYFHPEFQMKLVNLLLRYISNLDLHSIRNINILIATHSPFVVSDIPQNNILGLNDGLPKPTTVNPFGANIFEILHSSFFLDNFIGDFSSSKIQEIVALFDNRVKPFSEAQADRIRKKINMIGDEMIRRILLSSLNELTVIK